MRTSTFTIVLASSLVTLAPALGADRASRADSVQRVGSHRRLPRCGGELLPRSRARGHRDSRAADSRRRDSGRAVHRAARRCAVGDASWTCGCAAIRGGTSRSGSASGPEVYYVPVAVAPGPPYGRALGHYKKKHRKQWRTIVLNDADVVNLVELRFLSEHYHVAPERIIELRGSDRDFVAIHCPSARPRERPRPPRQACRKTTTSAPVRKQQGPRQRPQLKSRAS